MKIGTWNVTTLKNNICRIVLKVSRIDILTNKFRRFKLDLLAVSETHITGVGSMTQDDIEFVYSGRKEGVHRQKVGFMMNKDTAKFSRVWFYPPLYGSF